jgi:hypothetical protein
MQCRGHVACNAGAMWHAMQGPCGMHCRGHVACNAGAMWHAMEGPCGMQCRDHVACNAGAMWHAMQGQLLSQFCRHVACNAGAAPQPVLRHRCRATEATMLQLPLLMLLAPASTAREVTLQHLPPNNHLQPPLLLAHLLLLQLTVVQLLLLLLQQQPSASALTCSRLARMLPGNLISTALISGRACCSAPHSSSAMPTCSCSSHTAGRQGRANQ